MKVIQQPCTSQYEVGVGRHFPPEKPDILFKLISNLMVGVIINPAIYVFMNLLNRTRVSGRKNIWGLKPPWILASNHLTLLDDLFIEPVILFPQIYFGYRYIPYHAPEERNFYRRRLISWFMRQSKSIPVVRGKGLNQIGVDRLIEAVKDGGILHIYPEGTRSRSGDIGSAKPGVGRIVQETGVPVVPVYHQGLEQVLPIGAGFPKIGKEIRISIGKPIRFDTAIEPGRELQRWKEISEEILEAIREQQQVAIRRWGFRPTRPAEELETFGKKPHLKKS